jgi:D-erythrulose 1-phosphate 3-epimerase
MAKKYVPAATQPEVGDHLRGSACGTPNTSIDWPRRDAITDDLRSSRLISTSVALGAQWGVAPNLSLGFNTCFAVKRWPEPERWMAVLRERLGLRHCQISLDLFEPGLDPSMVTSAARSVARAARRSDVVLHSTFTGLAGYSSNLLLHPDPEARRASRRWFERAIDLTAEMGVAGTGGFLGALSASDAATMRMREQRIAELIEAMAGLSEHAARAGLSFLLFENMAAPREFGHSIPESHRLEELGAGGPVPWILCLDLGHPCALSTGTPSDEPLNWLDESWQHTPVIQIQQANRGGDFHWPFTPERNAVGSLSPRTVVESLVAAGTDTSLFFEIIHPAEHPDDAVLDDLRQSVECWRAALAAQDVIVPDTAESHVEGAGVDHVG